MGVGVPGNLADGNARGMTTQSQWAALRSPVFGAALLVLVANDHWLKGAGLLPGWLTGKLSDFAGLVVAPILLATLARARTRSARLVCFGFVAAGFGAIKLWPAAARGLEHLTRAVEFGWRIWPDPTDLVAFVVLPLGWWVLHCSDEPARSTGQRWWVERVVAMAAMLACVATSRDADIMLTSLAILNTTHEAVELQVFRPSTALDCDAVVADPESALTAADFAFESCIKLEPLQPVPLDLDWSTDDEGEVHTPPPGSERVCDAVLLRAPGLEDTVLFWNDVPKVEVDGEGGISTDAAHLVYLEQVGDRLFAERPDVAQRWLASFTLPVATCEVEAP
mgnify:CR=1 FL=1